MPEIATQTDETPENTLIESMNDMKIEYENLEKKLSEKSDYYTIKKDKKRLKKILQTIRDINKINNIKSAAIYSPRADPHKLSGDLYHNTKLINNIINNNDSDYDKCNCEDSHCDESDHDY